MTVKLELSGWGFITLAGGKSVKAPCALTISTTEGKTEGWGTIDTEQVVAQEMCDCEEPIKLELNGHKAQIVVSRPTSESRLRFHTVGSIVFPK
jgi:hypothetical protein